jgi:hypothetical protein
MCAVIGGFIVKDFIGKQDFLPKAVDIFISYSSPNREQAYAIHSQISAANKTSFLAEMNLEPGGYWQDQIRDTLKYCDAFWIVVSPDSLKSQWVTTEWAIAWALEKVIVPILYRCGPESLPERLRERQCIDFHQVTNYINSLK